MLRVIRANSHNKLQGVFPCRELELRLSKIAYASLDRLLVTCEVILLTTKLARGIFGCILQRRGSAQGFFVPVT